MKNKKTSELIFKLKITFDEFNSYEYSQKLEFWIENKLNWKDSEYPDGIKREKMKKNIQFISITSKNDYYLVAGVYCVLESSLEKLVFVKAIYKRNANVVKNINTRIIL